jgi:hypothetical protein
VPQPTDAVPFHFERVALELDAPERCTVHFSQFSTPFVGVEGAPVGAVRRSAQGTIDVVLEPGHHRLVLARRGVIGALLAAGEPPR